MLQEAFEMTPGILGKNPLLAFLAGPGLSEIKPSPNPLKVQKMALATDDWPFFWMAGRQMPTEYRTTLEMVLLISIVLLLILANAKSVIVAGQSWHFFFLGAGFLLIETVSVTRFALLFGSTWMVNSIVFSAILLVILLANLWMNRLPSLNIHLLYALLAGAVVVNFVFPMHELLRTGLVARLLLAMALMASPIFFAAFIFAHSYKDTSIANLAFAANLLGAVIGGLLEYTSLIIGFRSLLLIALVLYALSYVALFLPMRKTSAAAI
jgi:hypothetical protein